MRKLSLGNALFITFFVTLALLGLQYAGLRFFGLPFSPFDLYDALTRSGFAPWLSLIETTTALFSAGGRNSAETLVLVQWTLSLGVFALVAFLAGGLVWLVLGRRPLPPDALDGATMGAAWGLPMMVLALFAGRSIVAPVVIIAWILGLYILWGLAHSLSYRRLMRPVAAPVEPQLPVDEEGEPDLSSEPTLAVDPATAARVDRRSFLFQLGASTAAITAVSATAGAVLGGEQPDPRLRPPFPLAGAELWAAQEQLLNNFRRFAVVRFPPDNPAAMTVVALGAEYPDRHYVSVWLGDGSPIVVYESLETVLGAYNTADEMTDFLWLDR